MDCVDTSLATVTGAPSPRGFSFNFLNDIVIEITEAGTSFVST
ncbi:hypothetical protein [Sporosarcina sp. P26b]